MKSFDIDPNFRNINRPVGVDLGVSHPMPKQINDTNNNEMKFTTNREWTNVRGYGNIVRYREDNQDISVTYKTSPWNREK